MDYSCSVFFFLYFVRHVYDFVFEFVPAFRSKSSPPPLKLRHLWAFLCNQAYFARHGSLSLFLSFQRILCCLAYWFYFRRNAIFYIPNRRSDCVWGRKKRAVQTEHARRTSLSLAEVGRVAKK